SRAQTRKTETLDRALPGEKLFDRQRIALARVFEAEQAAAHRDNDFRFATDDPSLGIGRRQISQRQRAAVRADHVAHARPALLLNHISHTPPSLPVPEGTECGLRNGKIPW